MKRNLLEGIKHSNIARAARLLPKRDRTKIVAVVFLQVLLGLLDLLGIALIGILGALAIRGIEGQQAGDRVSQFLKLVNLENQSLQFQVSVIGTLAALFLISKTLLSLFFREELFISSVVVEQLYLLIC